MSQVLAYALQHAVFVAAVIVTVLAIAATSVESIHAHRAASKISVEEVFAPDEAQRLWDHALHEDRQFNERLYFFLVFESVLLGVVGALYTRTRFADVAIWAIAILGLCMALMWVNVQVRQKYYLDTFGPRLELLPEFKRTAQFSRKWRSPTLFMISYGLPFAVALVWLAFIALLNGAIG